ncbi:MAG: KilA-N domain-containing protein [Desulfobacterales bacterium]|nr:KilA-N domain-containing protein [Desulfobacterales bacterium]
MAHYVVPLCRSVLFSARGSSLTDIARYKNPHKPKDVVKNWMRSKNTIEFLGLWEILNNPKFKVVEFDHFKNEAGARCQNLEL